MRADSQDAVPDKPTKTEFLISFLVDARGGSMTGSRRPGIKMVIPPQSAEQPIRITCRQLRPDQVLHLPPLSEGEGLACRILQLTPAPFLAPVLIEVPHFASITNNREIIVLRSDTGKKWFLHSNTTDNENLERFLATSTNNLVSNNNNKSTNMTTITTLHFPQYFAIISRPYQETSFIGPDGGVLRSQLEPQAQCSLPPHSITKQISLGLSVLPVKKSITQDIVQQGGAVSSIITIEQRRRKFHKPITVTIPVPGGQNQNQNLVMLCSMSGSGYRAIWEDVTSSTPLTFHQNCVQFTSVVSAQFWLFRLPAGLASEKLAIAERLFRSATMVPYIARLFLFWRESEAGEDAEVELRVVLATEEERSIDNPLEERENFNALAKSEELDITEKSDIQISISGNLAPTSGTSQKLVFRPFTENRATLSLKRKEINSMAAGKVEIVMDEEVVLFKKHMVLNLEGGRKMN